LLLNQRAARHDFGSRTPADVPSANPKWVGQLVREVVGRVSDPASTPVSVTEFFGRLASPIPISHLFYGELHIHTVLWALALLRNRGLLHIQDDGRGQRLVWMDDVPASGPEHRRQDTQLVAAECLKLAVGGRINVAPGAAP
jgi:hypothetical protein